MAFLVFRLRLLRLDLPFVDFAQIEVVLLCLGHDLTILPHSAEVATAATSFLPMLDQGHQFVLLDQ